MQGQIPGLNIQTNSGQPGANSLIQLRGPSSINGNTEPLIILDGIPIDEDIFRTIDPQDIAKQTILKDAAGTAIYGNRGANGVILIETKRGDFGQALTVRYSSSIGFTELGENDYDLYSSRGYLALENRRNVGLGATLSPAEIQAYNVDTDWRDEFFRTGLTQSHSFQISSGGKNTNQFTSVGYTEQEGALRNTDLQRFNIRNNVSGKSDNGKFTFNTSTYLGYSKQQNPQIDQNSVSRIFIYFNPISGANRGLPYLDPQNYDSIIANPQLQGTGGLFNAANSPYILEDNLRFAADFSNELKLVLGGNANYQFDENWSATYEIGVDYSNRQTLDYENPRSALSRVRANIAGIPEQGTQGQSNVNDFRFNSKVRVGYTDTFGADDKHTILSNVYLESVSAQFNSFNYNQTGLTSRTFSPGNGAGFRGDTTTDDIFVPGVGANKLTYSLFSYFGEVDYDYDGKYGFQATLRRDGSSKFSDENRYGTFYSVAGRWNIGRENFLQDSKVINSLKLRASYGSNGNDRILGGFYGGLNLNRQLFASGNGYLDNQTFLRSATIGNPDLTWETVTTANLGIDFELFEQRLRGSIDIYNKLTTDLFFERFLSGVNGTYSQRANFGDLQNRGVDLAVNYDLIRSKEVDGFNLTLNFVGNYNRNKVLDIDSEGGQQDNQFFVRQEGEALDSWFLVPYAGVNPANGNLLYRDINDNLTETATLEDRRIAGNRIPDFSGSFGFNMSYKGFFFENQWTYVTGISNVDQNERQYLDINNIGSFQLANDLERAWTPTNRITDIPSLDATNNNEPVLSDRFLRSTNFLRLRFVQFGYNFSQEILDDSFLKSARVFVNAENLVTFSKWRGSDPESPTRGFLNGGGTLDDAGVFNEYPLPTIISTGIEITF